jgi:hypothetical protein
MQMAQSMPQGAMRDEVKGFFVMIHGIKSRPCKKLLPSLSPHPVPRLIGRTLQR